MRALIQRVTEAKVVVDNEVIAAIDQGLLVFLAVDHGDDEQRADKLLHKLLHYRVFADKEDKMNLNVQEVCGALLIVSQFTLSADTRKGLRPSFTGAASPAHAEVLYNYFLTKAKQRYAHVACGRFAANMAVSLVNDGPVTFLLEG